MTIRSGQQRALRRGVAAIAIGGVLAGGGAAAIAAPPPPPLGLVAASPQATLYRVIYEGDEEGEEGGGTWIEGELGVHVIAGRQPFEIRVKRKSYRDPIVGYRVTGKKGEKTQTKLPAGMVNDFAGLRSFHHFTLRDAAGKTVLDQDQDFCPNAYESSRTRHDAPDTNPYPMGCSGGNPFLLGAVLGVQAGWNSPIYPQVFDDLAAGKYKATISINEKYRNFFKIPAKAASVTLDVTVVERRYDEDFSSSPLRARRAPIAARGHGTHGAHATEGDPSQQVSAYSAKLRPAARRPVNMARRSVPKGPRPDLRSLPAWGIGIIPPDLPVEEGGAGDGRTYLGFGATVWNAGSSPLVVDGFRRTGTELMDAYQYFYNAKGKQVGSVKAGTMEWDKRDGHLHWHFTDFAQYRLLKADKKVAVRSGKESFCLANTDAVDYTIPHAEWRPGNVDLRTSCGANSAVAVRQVLDVGSGDTYGQWLPGQSFDVTDLPNGTYYIEVLANPENRLAESNLKNNSSLRKVILSGTKENRKLTVPPHQGIDG